MRPLCDEVHTFVLVRSYASQICNTRFYLHDPPKLPLVCVSP
eukprot:COSAG03_NODE_8782_length_772_cov_0.732541_1_plen_41_part_10